MLYRLYNFEFKDKAQPSLKNSIFLPSGFDSLLLIEALCKGTPQENKVFEEIIMRPATLN
jgi:hypothetical protein